MELLLIAKFAVAIILGVVLGLLLVAEEAPLCAALWVICILCVVLGAVGLAFGFVFSLLGDLPSLTQNAWLLITLGLAYTVGGFLRVCINEM